MCGIAGIASEIADPRSSVSTERMVAAIAHRGPDSHGVQISAAACLATRGSRLLT